MREKMEELKEFVELHNDAVIMQLKIDDREVVDWVSQMGDPSERTDAVKRALKVGVIAMGSAFVSGTYQTIHEALGRWKSDVESALLKSREEIIRSITEQFGRQVSEPFRDQIEQITRNAVDRIRERVDDLERRVDPNHPDSWLKLVHDTIDTLKEEFDPSREGSYLWLVRDTLAKFYGRDGDAVKCITDAVNQALKPIQDDLQQISESIGEIRVRLGGLAPERGRGFEREAVGSLLGRISSVTGDICEHVGRDGRSGDWLIHVCYGGVNDRQVVGKIVIEAKDTERSKPQIQNDIENAMEIRKADVGILIFARPDQNPYHVPFTVLDDNYTRMVCVWDEEGLSLSFAYQLARLCILEKHLRATAEIDWANLRRQVQDTINEVNRIDELANKARLAKERAEEAERMSYEIKRSLLSRLQSLEREIGLAQQ